MKPEDQEKKKSGEESFEKKESPISQTAVKRIKKELGEPLMVHPSRTGHRVGVNICVRRKAVGKSMFPELQVSPKVGVGLSVQ